MSTTHPTFQQQQNALCIQFRLFQCLLSYNSIYIISSIQSWLKVLRSVWQRFLRKPTRWCFKTSQVMWNRCGPLVVLLLVNKGKSLNALFVVHGWGTHSTAEVIGQCIKGNEQFIERRRRPTAVFIADRRCLLIIHVSKTCNTWELLCRIIIDLHCRDQWRLTGKPLHCLTPISPFKHKTTSVEYCPDFDPVSIYFNDTWDSILNTMVSKGIPWDLCILLSRATCDILAHNWNQLM